MLQHPEAPKAHHEDDGRLHGYDVIRLLQLIIIIESCQEKPALRRRC